MVSLTVQGTFWVRHNSSQTGLNWCWIKVTPSLLLVSFLLLLLLPPRLLPPPPPPPPSSSSSSSAPSISSSPPLGLLLLLSFLIKSIQQDMIIHCSVSQQLTRCSGCSGVHNSTNHFTIQFKMSIKTDWAEKRVWGGTTDDSSDQNTDRSWQTHRSILINTLSTHIIFLCICLFVIQWTAEPVAGCLKASFTMKVWQL